MLEQWIDIEESNCYELNNYGKLRHKQTKIEKSYTYIKKGAYKAYCINGKQYSAHRLVAKYFVQNDNPELKNVVNHLDENTHNNRADNLEWTTNKENLKYSNAHERVSKKMSKYKVIQYDENGNIIKIWNSKEQCARNGYAGAKNALDKNTFNRYFNGYFWFKETEFFDKTRYKPCKIINIYNKYTNKLLFTGGVRDCANYLHIKDYDINNTINRTGIYYMYKLVVINDKL